MPFSGFIAFSKETAVTIKELGRVGHSDLARQAPSLARRNARSAESLRSWSEPLPGKV
ncbi:hypothetical protein [Candidatus Rariloculus sp.]|uniref:hypothetical protein n=1 Tax=Candidatus Rariloculus sp. TaxID=3101265 RepID=UPI003D0F170D